MSGGAALASLALGSQKTARSACVVEEREEP